MATTAAILTLLQRWGVLFAALWSMVLAEPAHAQQTISSYNDARSGAVMTVPVNKSQTLRVDRQLSKAVVGNPLIADVVPVSLTSVYILGKSIGSTNVSLFDRKGGIIAVVDVVVAPDSQGLKRKLAELMPTEAIGVTVSNDSVVLDGRISSPAASERAASIAETFAPKKVINMMSMGTPQQVLLEVRFSEMSRGTVKQLGINSVSWNGSGSAGIIGSPGLGDTNAFIGSFAFPGGLQFRIDALEQQGLIRTLAQPNLIALSGETANFLAGGEFPIPTGVTQNGQISIEFKQFGVSLSFTPTILEDGMINLLVAPEVSSLDRDAGITLQGVVIPGLKTRRARTSLELRDGQSLAIAGLIQSDFADTVRGVPLLGKIPIIGALFRSTDFQRSETELVIVVTPRIIRPVAPGSIVYPSDRVREPSDVDLFINGQSEKRVPMKSLVGAPSASVVKPGGVDGDFGHIVR
nr:type II and III secretion system protein family protein [Polymorphobacter sp.]